MNRLALADDCCVSRVRPDPCEATATSTPLDRPTCDVSRHSSGTSAPGIAFDTTSVDLEVLSLPTE